MKKTIYTLFFLLTFSPAYAQTVRDLIIQKPVYASCNYNTYPDSIPNNLTPTMAVMGRATSAAAVAMTSLSR